MDGASAFALAPSKKGGRPGKEVTFAKSWHLLDRLYKSGANSVRMRSTFLEENPRFYD